MRLIGRNLKEKTHEEDCEQMAMLKWRLIKRDEKTWHEFFWFMIEIGG